MNYRILYSEKIDKIKWDKCVNESLNTRYYALTSFLDSIAERWAGIIWADYEAVMPIVYKQVSCIKLVAQPLFCQQLGIYSNRVELLNIDNSILKFLDKHFFVVSYAFNTENIFQDTNKLVCRNTDELIIRESYECIADNYSKNHKKNISRATKKQLHIRRSDDYELFFKMLRDFYKIKNITIVKEHNLKSISQAINRLTGRLYVVVNDKNKPVLAAYFIKNGNTHSFITANTDEGYYTRARYFIIDHFIQLVSIKKGIIDFAGSDIEAISSFNRGFGSSSRKYYQYENRRNIVILTLFKKILFWRR